MKLQQVNVHNFGCFTDFSIDFPQTNGFYLIAGNNLDNPALGANGCGKTTLFNSIFWALYGRSARGSKAGKLLNRNTGLKGYMVSLKFDDHVLHRSWSPNSLQLDGKEIQQAQLNELIGFTDEQFLYSIYLSQNANHFIDLSPSEKLNFLSTIFQLDRWVAYSDVAKTKAKNVEISIAQRNAEVTHLKREIDTYEYDFGVQIGLEKDWDRAQKAKIKATQDAIDSLKQSADRWQREHQQKIAEKQNQYTEQSAKLKAIEETDHRERRSQIIDKLQAIDILVLEHRERELSIEHTLHLSEIDRLKNQIEKLSNSADSDCPTCGQKISTDHIGQCCLKLIDQIEEEQKQAAALLSPWNEAKSNLTKATELIKELTQQKDDLTREIILHDADIKSNDQIQSLLQNLKRDIDHEINVKNPYEDSGAYDKKLQEEQSETNPHHKIMSDIRKRIEELQKMVSELEADQKLDKEFDSYQFWLKTFPRVRLWILDDIIQELELHFNQALTNLGLMNWVIQVHTDRELKDERVKKELNLKIMEGESEIDFETLSGGERQRVKLAIAVGIGDLITSRVGQDWNFRFFDEPSLGLSAEGISSMLDFFSGLSENGQQIYLADHRLMGLDNFDAIFTVTKHPDGCSTIAHEIGQHSLDRIDIPTREQNSTAEDLPALVAGKKSRSGSKRN